MAFVKKTWKDRLVEFAGRRTLKRISGSADSQMVVDVSRNEGTVSQAGDAFSAANMNDLEQRIADEFSSINNNLGGYSFGETADGKPGYRKPGADTVIPFSSAYIYKNVNLGTYKALQDGVAYLFFWSYASSGTYDGIIFTTTGSGKRIGYQSYSGQQSFLYQFNLKAGQTITTQPGPEYINSNGTLVYPNGMF